MYRDIITHLWIANNPPARGERVSDYYAKYVLALGDDITIDAFNELVSARGYVIVRDDMGQLVWMRVRL